MNATLAATIVVLGLASPTFADVTLKQTTTGKGMGMSSTMPGTTYIKGLKMRTETVLGDATTGALRHRLPREHGRMARAITQHRHIIDLWAAGRLDQATEEISSHVLNVARLLTTARLDDISTA